MCSRIASVPWFAAAVALGLGGCTDSTEPSAAVSGGVELTGMYTYMADAAMFEDCASGERLPVLIEAAHIDVERAYLEMRTDPGAPLLLTARFEVVERPPEPGMPVRKHLRVVKFDRFRPEDDCPP